jgi:hypothetical protein
MMPFIIQAIIFYGFFGLLIAWIAREILGSVLWWLEPRDSKELKRIKRQHLGTKIGITDDGHVVIRGFKPFTPQWTRDSDDQYALLPARGKLVVPNPPEKPVLPYFEADGTTPRNATDAEIKLYHEEVAKWEEAMHKYETNEMVHATMLQDRFNDLITKKFIMKSTGSPVWFEYFSKAVLYNPAFVKFLETLDSKKEKEGEPHGMLLDPTKPKVWIDRSWPESAIHQFGLKKEEVGSRKQKGMMNEKWYHAILFLIIVSCIGIAIIIAASKV